MKDRGLRSSVTLNTSVGSDYERNENDYYATDPAAIDHLFAVEEFGARIWEPACGGGHLSRQMEREHGKVVYSTDLIDRGWGDSGVNFFEQLDQWNGDIITNPPYSCATQFVEHALSLVAPGCKVAMLMRIQFLEGKRRKELFRINPPRAIHVYSTRLVCARNGDFEKFKNNSGAMVYAWYVWQKGYVGQTIINWIN